MFDSFTLRLCIEVPGATIRKMGPFAFLRPIIDVALPPRCPNCGVTTVDPSQFCLGCWQQLIFLSDPSCLSCGTPVPLEGGQCGPCMLSSPKHDGVRAAVAYGDVARNVVLKLKYGRRLGMADAIAKIVKARANDKNVEIYAPVPLHRWRIWSRGFNQSLVIAKAMKLPSQEELVPDLLLRKKPTPQLKGMGRTERANAVKGAFVVNPAFLDRVKNKNICLIDDVYTSGATINACASALKRAGAARVTGLVWARVVNEDGT